MAGGLRLSKIQKWCPDNELHAVSLGVGQMCYCNTFGALNCWIESDAVYNVILLATKCRYVAAFRASVNVFCFFFRK